MQFHERKRRKVTINITSLIDVVFLLLIFFMVSTTFIDQPGISLDLPNAQSTVEAEPDEVILTISPDGNLYLDGKQILLKQLKAALENKFDQHPNKTLILKADKDVSHGIVVQVMDTAKIVGIEKLVVATKVE